VSGPWSNFVTHDLSPSTHISEIVAKIKAHQRANIILRCLSNDKRLLLRAFFVYVRPILFSRVVTVREKEILTALKRYNGNLQRDYLALKSMSYTDRVKCLGLTTLELHAPFTP